METTLREPTSFADLAVVRLLFEEYRASLGVDLCFQGFDEELATLPGEYGRSRGGLWLAMADAQAAGCAGLRPFENDACEMKRLYVRQRHRGKGLGRRLAETVVQAAKKLGYRRMFLDTLANMAEATTLYRDLGFREREPYRHDPLSGVIYFELDLT